MIDPSDEAVGVQTSIADHRLLGDGWSAALVRPDGTVDWWCAPAIDSPPLLWQLLDVDGPTARWHGAEAVSTSDDVAGPGLRTTVTVGGSQVELLDGLLHLTTGAVLVRLVRAVGEPVAVEHRMELGGFEGEAVSWDPEGAGDADGFAVSVTGHGDTVVSGATARTVLHAVCGEWRGVLVTVGEVDSPTVAEAAAAVEGAITSAGEFASTCRLPDHGPELGERALAVLTACTSVASGAVVASPTTSLPEVIGGDRQFDYRYCWQRDSAQAVAVASMLGKTEAAAELLLFLSNLGPERLLESPVFDIRGDDIPAERELLGRSGWRGSRPVRVGNGAADQVQHDVLGLVLEAIETYSSEGATLRRSDWAIVGALADRALREPGPSNGIWELREPAMVVSADIGRWIALDRASALAARHRHRWVGRRRRWVRAADDTRRKVTDALRDDGGLPRVYGDGGHDASALLAVMYGLIEPDDPRAAALVDATIAALGEGPFIRRYGAEVDDGFSPGEGAFVPCSWWAVSALAVIGRHDQARARATAMLDALDGLQAEEVDPHTGDALGNIPLVWSHTEAARAMVILDRTCPSTS